MLSKFINKSAQKSSIFSSKASFERGLILSSNLIFSSLRLVLSSVFRGFPDHRQKGKVKHSLHDAAMAAFACMHFQDKSFLQFEKRVGEALHPENLKKLFDIQTIPEATQIRLSWIALKATSLALYLRRCFQNCREGNILNNIKSSPDYITSLWMLRSISTQKRLAVLNVSHVNIKMAKLLADPKYCKQLLCIQTCLKLFL